MYGWNSNIDANDSYGSYGAGAKSFNDVRRAYSTDTTPNRTYAGTVSAEVIRRNAVYTWESPFLKTDAHYALVIGMDMTGSMSRWPELHFFPKLPLLYGEAIQYLPDCEISFQSINDWFADGCDVALQPGPFAKGEDLDKIIGELYPVGGGGGQVTESYEIFAAYNSCIEAPNAIMKPIVIIIGDEAPFEHVPDKVAKAYGLKNGNYTDKYPSKDAFARLHENSEVFLIRKSYYDQDSNIEQKWQTIGGMSPERILMLEKPERIIDVILGILGILTGKEDYFTEEITTRQIKDDNDVDGKTKVNTVLKTLDPYRTSVHSSTGVSKTDGIKSVSHANVSKGKTTRGLVIDGDDTTKGLDKDGPDA